MTVSSSIRIHEVHPAVAVGYPPGQPLHRRVVSHVTHLGDHVQLIVLAETVRQLPIVA
jgi:hypothetical protein